MAFPTLMSSETKPDFLLHVHPSRLSRFQPDDPQPLQARQLTRPRANRIEPRMSIDSPPGTRRVTFLEPPLTSCGNSISQRNRRQLCEPRYLLNEIKRNTERRTHCYSCLLGNEITFSEPSTFVKQSIIEGQRLAQISHDMMRYPWEGEFSWTQEKQKEEMLSQWSSVDFHFLLQNGLEIQDITLTEIVSYTGKIFG